MPCKRRMGERERGKGVKERGGRERGKEGWNETSSIPKPCSRMSRAGFTVDSGHQGSTNNPFCDVITATFSPKDLLMVKNDCYGN